MAIDSTVSRRRRSGRASRPVSRSIGRTAAHRDAIYRQRRAEHEDRARRRRRREVPTYADAALDVVVSLVVAGGFGYLAAITWPAEAPAAVCAALAAAFGWSGLVPLGALALGRHPAQVRVREQCSVCGALSMPGRAARRHLRRERRAARGPARSTTVRVR